MNEQIKELWNKVDRQEEGTRRSIVITTESELDKFAELIVRECAELVGGYTKENEFGSASDVKEAYEEITKHFGVE